MTGTRGEMPFVKYDADGRIDQDLPCSECGYNLRTLLDDDHCPKCGASVHESARLASLAEPSASRPPSGCLVALTAAAGFLTFVGIQDVEFGVPPGGADTRGAERWVWQVPAVLACLSLLALVFRLGWLLPCTVIGALLGGFLCAPGAGNVNSEMQGYTTWILVDAVVGAIVGMALDRPPEPSTAEPNDATRRESCGHRRRPGLAKCPECGAPYESEATQDNDGRKAPPAD